MLKAQTGPWRTDSTLTGPVCQSVKEPPNRQNVNLENVFMTHRQKTLEGEIAFAII